MAPTVRGNDFLLPIRPRPRTGRDASAHPCALTALVRCCLAAPQQQQQQQPRRPCGRPSSRWASARASGGSASRSTRTRTFAAGRRERASRGAGKALRRSLSVASPWPRQRGHDRQATVGHRKRHGAAVAAGRRSQRGRDAHRQLVPVRGVRARLLRVFGREPLPCVVWEGTCSRREVSAGAASHLRD